MPAGGDQAIACSREPGAEALVQCGEMSPAIPDSL
jgi:hypothetical protein